MSLRATDERYYDSGSSCGRSLRFPGIWGISGFGFGFTALGREGFMGCCLEAWLDSNKRLQSHRGLWCSSINAYDMQGGGAW